MRVIAFLVFVAIAVAQVTEFSANSMKLDTLLPLPLSTGYETQLNYYKVWIPETASGVSTTFTTTGTASTKCDLYLYHNFAAVPCGTDYPVGSTVNPCTAGAYTEAYDSYPVVSSTVFGPTGGSSSSNRAISYAAGAYLYLSVTRYSDTYDSQPCPYTIYVNVTNCPANQTGVYDRATSATVCRPVMNWATTNNAASTMVSGPAGETILKVVLPENVGTATITLLSNVSSTYLVANNGFAASYDDNYEYYSDYSVANGTNYLTVLSAYVPRSGAFYIVVADDSNSYTAQVNISYTVCPAGFGGWNCTYRSRMLNASMNGMLQVLNANEAGAIGNEGPIDNYYVDSMQNSTMELNLTVTVNPGASGYLYYKRNGYTEYASDYGYDEESSISSSGSILPLGLTWHNFYPGGRIYMGVQNLETTASMNYTLSLTSGTGTSGGSTGSTGSTSASTGASTTDSTSGATGATSASTSASTGASATTNTGSTTSGVAAVAYSAVVVVVAALALVL